MCAQPGGEPACVCTAGEEGHFDCAQPGACLRFPRRCRKAAGLSAPSTSQFTPAPLPLTPQASIAATLQFVPAVLMPFPTYRGIWVEASVQLKDPLTDNPTGPSLKTVPVGSIVVITVQVGGEAVGRLWGGYRGETMRGLEF